MQLSRFLPIVSLLWLANAAPVGAFTLRVAVAQNISQIDLGTSTPAIVADENDRQIGVLAAQKGFTVRANNDRLEVGSAKVAQLWVKPQAGGYIWIGDRWYRGSVRVVAAGKKLTAIEHVNLEHYLYSVLGAEMSPSYPAEALKAQAVASRTYALYRSQSTQGKLFDLDSTQSSQVYRGLGSEATATISAVNATADEIMTEGGKPILAAFHAASGGHTENVEDIWTNRLSYLRGVPDYDLDTPGNEWTKTFSAQEIGNSLNISNLKSIVPDRTSQFGSVLSLKISGDSDRTIKGSQVRTALKLRSLKFTIAPTSNGFMFTGRGYGHGLGMSQWGAYYLAQQGQKYSSILTHYYRGVKLMKLTN